VNCTQTRKLIGAHLDGELDLMASLDFNRHVECCSACAAAQERLQTVRSAVTASAPYYPAPPQLAAQLRAALRLEVMPQPTPQLPRSIRPWRAFLRPLGMAAALALVATLSWVVARQSVRGGGATLAHEIVAAHVRSLMADHLYDVRSSDQHTVKPWFSGKVDFAPNVRDLVSVGFPLEGGRLDYLDGHAVAALVYRHNLHVINCFVWPTQGAQPPLPTSAQGYNLIRFSDRGLTWCVISDAAPATLEEFARALRANATTMPVKVRD
jgi:anti-sigma factor RsiW